MTAWAPNKYQRAPSWSATSPNAASASTTGSRRLGDRRGDPREECRDPPVVFEVRFTIALRRPCRVHRASVRAQVFHHAEHRE
jgi:hypothetical protein